MTRLEAPRFVFGLLALLTGCSTTSLDASVYRGAYGRGDRPILLPFDRHLPDHVPLIRYPDARSTTSGPAVTAHPTVDSASLASTATSSPRCRTFFAHGDSLGRDGVEYSTLLLWREHASPEPPPGLGLAEGPRRRASSRTLAVNVTATQSARVMLGSATRGLPGQPFYELVLGATPADSRLLIHHVKGESPVQRPDKSPPLLFESGSLQLWVRWTLEGQDADDAERGSKETGLLEVTVLAAGWTAPKLLFSYNTTKPIQLETFSFGSTSPGDVSFTVCHPVRPASNSSTPTDEQPGALGVPGCRSLFVHVQSSHTHVHNLALSWPDTADHHGRLQFWARASTDVEVLVAAGLHLKRNDPKYHVVFGGDFNTRSWIVGYERTGSRAAITDTPALLSDLQFRPLWLSISSHGELKAGSGDIHNHTRSKSRTLLSWPHPGRPAAKFVSFATYRQRFVHVLIDCATPPFQPSAVQQQSTLDDMLDSVRNSVASSLASPRSAAPALELDIHRLALHNGTTLSATGTLVQWQHLKGMEWNPYWFERLKKIQFWLIDEDVIGTGRGIQIPSLFLSSKSGIKSKANLEAGPIEVNADKMVRWNFPVSLKLPCREDTEEQTISCSTSLQLISRSDNCHIARSMHLDHKWKVEWNIASSNETNTCIIGFKATSSNYRHLKEWDLSAPHIQQRVHKGWLHLLYTMLTTAALVIFILGSKIFSRSKYSQCCFLHFSFGPQNWDQSLLPEQDKEEKNYIVDYNGQTAEITKSSVENSLYDNQASILKDSKGTHHLHKPALPMLHSEAVIILLLSACVFLSIFDMAVGLGY